MATAARIQAAAEAIADALEASGLVKRCLTYPAPREKLAKSGDAVLTLRAAADAGSEELSDRWTGAFGRGSRQTVEWMLQMVFASTVTGSGRKTENTLAGLFAADSDDSLFGVFRAMRANTADRFGSPILTELEVEHFVDSGDEAVATLVIGIVQAQL